MLKKLKLIINTLDKKNRFYFYLLIGFIFISSIFDAIGIISILPFLTLLLNTELVETNQYLNKIFTLVDLPIDNFILLTGVFYLAIVLIGIFVRFVSKFLIEIFSRNVLYDTSNKVYKLYLFKPYKFHLFNNKAYLAQKTTHYVETLIAGVLVPALLIYNLSLNLLLIILISSIFEPIIPLTIIIFMGVYYLFFFKKASKKVEKSGNKYSKFNQEFSKLLIDSFSIIRQIRLNFKESYFLKKFSDLAKGYRNANITQYIYSNIPILIIDSFVYLVISIIALSVYFLSDNYQTYIPLIIFTLVAARRIIPASQEIYSQILQINFHEKMNSKIINDIKDLVKENSNRIKDKKIILDKKLKFKKEISFRNTKFSYTKKSKKFLFNLSIKRGEFIGIIGKSGNGKSTFINLLCGFLKPISGEIKIDGKILDQGNLRAWQNKISYVPQEVYLFDGSIEKNILIENTNEINSKKIKNLKKILKLKFNFQDKPSREMKFQIGKQGLNLSGGQRQKISIARSLSKDPEIIVFDEATNSLDSENENYIINNIRKFYSNCTFIFATHRTEILKKCDKIVFFENGKIKNCYEYGEFKKVQQKLLKSIEKK